LKLDNFPEQIQNEIYRQIVYILYMLEKNHINHRHSHFGNFNLRFLLEKGEEKQLVFDPEHALTLASTPSQGWNITPIVTLRDWDAATSST